MNTTQAAQLDPVSATITALVTGSFGPSPLDGVDPVGRVDVLCGGIIRKAAAECGNPHIAGIYPVIRPAVDAALANAFSGVNGFAAGVLKALLGRMQ